MEVGVGPVDVPTKNTVEHFLWESLLVRGWDYEWIGWIGVALKCGQPEVRTIERPVCGRLHNIGWISNEPLKVHEQTTHSLFSEECPVVFVGVAHRTTVRVSRPAIAHESVRESLA